MRSNYKRLGDYIERCDEINEGMAVQDLLGISNNKYFQKSHTNIIGIDLTKYRIVRSNQFAFNRATTRNGDKISIALRKGGDCIVSPSYRIFKSKDEYILNSEYLMMWFNRPEFDRYARFKSHGSAHEFFDWEEMCEVAVPIPSPKEQLEIVKEHNVIQNRIKLSKELIAKLEETAQAIYKRWFVDFEFPDETGAPYKINGGVMEESELGEIPKGWKASTLDKCVEVKYGKDYKHLKKGNIPLYGSGGVMSYVNLHLCANPSVLIPRKGSLNNILIINEPFWSVDTMFYTIPRLDNILYYVFYHLKTIDFSSLDVGSAVPSMTTNYLNSMPINIPEEKILKKYNNLINKLYSAIIHKTKELDKLLQVKDLVLAKMTKVEIEKEFA